MHRWVCSAGRLYRAGSVPSHQHLCFVGVCVDAFFGCYKVLFAVELLGFFVFLVHGQCQGEIFLLDELDEACSYALRLVARVDEQPCNVVAVEPDEA